MPLAHRDILAPDQRRIAIRVDRNRAFPLMKKRPAGRSSLPAIIPSIGYHLKPSEYMIMWTL